MDTALNRPAEVRQLLLDHVVLGQKLRLDDVLGAFHFRTLGGKVVSVQEINGMLIEHHSGISRLCYRHSWCGLFQSLPLLFSAFLSFTEYVFCFFLYLSLLLFLLVSCLLDLPNWAYQLFHVVELRVLSFLFVSLWFFSRVDFYRNLLNFSTREPTHSSFELQFCLLEKLIFFALCLYRLVFLLSTYFLRFESFITQGFCGNGKNISSQVSEWQSICRKLKSRC